MSKSFSEAVRSGEFVVTAECLPQRGIGVDQLKQCAATLSDLANGINVPDCEDGVRMSALAAGSHLISAGVEPILHLLTRDMNRIALQSAILGAASLGVKNILCTTGRHQALTTSRSARGVFDVDPTQLLQIADAMRKKGEFADGQTIDGKIDILLGTDTNPFSEPVELQVMTLEKAILAGADFVITQPVFKLDKFNEWMKRVRDKGLDKRTCIIASVMPLSAAREATAGRFDIGEHPELVEGPDVELASQTATALKAIEGVRGICIMAGENHGLAKDILTASGIARS